MLLLSLTWGCVPMALGLSSVAASSQVGLGGGRTRTSREEHARPLDRRYMESKSGRGRGQRARRDSVRPGALQSTQDTHMYGPIRGDIITPLLRQRSEARDKWWVQKHGPVSDEAGVTALLTPELPPGFGLG